MSETIQKVVNQICESCGNDRTRMMDIVIAVQKQFGAVGNEAMDAIAKAVNVHRVEVESVVSFYAFLSKESKGKVVIRLCNDVVDKMKGVGAVLKVFEEELGIKKGQTTADGAIGLEYTPCIGMSDQAPAALINDVVVPNVTVDMAKKIVQQLKENMDPAKLDLPVGDGNNTHELVGSAVTNNICKVGAVILADARVGAGLKNALALDPKGVIKEIKASKLRGRGGAGFPTGLKWEFTKAAKGEQKYILCNADEGEPGTFKDRVLLTEKADAVIEGMTIAGYAIGANTGILYIRAEYAYLRSFLEKVLSDRREKGLLGNNVGGKEGFNFDIRIQSGSGAYICGAESALISSCEGLRGDPKTRPPFPAQKGYLRCPTSVNNVETFNCASRILEKGGVWFAKFGTFVSKGTKLLSISGDCEKPGIYEYPFGVKVSDILKEVGASNTQAVLVGGPSGQLIAAKDFSRVICFDDLATGGSIVVFNDQRDILEIAKEYMEFFVEETCGYCTPCRVGNTLLLNTLNKILDGNGEPADLAALQELGDTVKFSSRCGLGQTSPNPILSTLKNFRGLYDAKVKVDEDGFQRDFNIQSALGTATQVQGRKSVIFEE